MQSNFLQPPFFESGGNGAFRAPCHHSEKSLDQKPTSRNLAARRPDFSRLLRAGTTSAPPPHPHEPHASPTDSFIRSLSLAPSVIHRQTNRVCRVARKPKVFGIAGPEVLQAVRRSLTTSRKGFALSNDFGHCVHEDLARRDETQGLVSARRFVSEDTRNRVRGSLSRQKPFQRLRKFVHVFDVGRVAANVSQSERRPASTT